MNVLTGKRALACGSTQGIGYGCAVELARLGAEVVLAARNDEALQRVRGELGTEAGQKHHYLCVDFSNPEAVRDKVAAFIQAHGPIHIVVNNTGGPPAGPIFDAKPDEFKTAMNNHLICNHMLAQAVVPGMKQAGYGRIINIISTSVKCPIPGLGVSNTTRGAVASWAKTLASELGRFGITVNNILPGYIGTARLRSLNERRSRDAGVSVEELEKRLLAEIPAGRFGTAEEVGAVVGFLASPAAGYVNGINLPVDGGRLPTL